MQNENVKPVELEEAELDAVVGGLNGRGGNTGVAG